MTSENALDHCTFQWDPVEVVIFYTLLSQKLPVRIPVHQKLEANDSSGLVSSFK